MKPFHPYQEYQYQSQPCASTSSNSPEPESADGVVKAGKFGKWSKESSGPVKNACLSCRTKKAKCDGVQPVCGQCSKKELECIYVKSKRGGARKKREAVPAPSALSEFLKKLDGLLKVPEYNLSPARSETSSSDDARNIVRVFSSREEILRCYFTEVHPFLTVMPPRHYLTDILPTLMDDSPFLLAAQTILTLLPHGQDPNPNSSQSRTRRQAASEALGDQTLESVDRVLHNKGLSLECVQALVMLSLWEWGNSGSLDRSRERSGRALQLAMQMGLHELDKGNEHDARSTINVTTGRAIEGVDWKKDMARRTWWTVYINQLISALVSGQEAVLGPDDPRVKVDFPICSVSDQSWPRWINVTRQCSRAFAMVNSLMYTHHGFQNPNSWGIHASTSMTEVELPKVQLKVMDLDRTVVELMKEAEQMSIISLVPGGEEEVCRNQQIAARFGIAVTHIHIHRHQAFPEVSLFSKKICGLPKAPDYVPPPMGAMDGIQPFSNDTHPSSSSIQPHIDNHTVEPNGYGAYYASDENGHHQQHVRPTAQLNALSNGSGETLAAVPSFDFIEDLWQPESFPSNLPTPWFAEPNGAAALYRPTTTEPIHAPSLDLILNTFPSNTAHVSQALSGMYAPVGDIPSSDTAYMTSNQSSTTPPQRSEDRSESISMTPETHGSGRLPNGSWTPQHPQNGGSIPVGSNWAPPHNGAASGSITMSHHGFMSGTEINPYSNTTSSSTDPNGEGTMSGNPAGARSTSVSSSTQSVNKPHKAWGVDINAQSTSTLPNTGSSLQSSISKPKAEPMTNSHEQSTSGDRSLGSAADYQQEGGGGEIDTWGQTVDTDIFPPGISLARCATAAHTIVRLEVLHHSASIALSNGPPRWLPFCACALVSGAYAFLLLALAVQAENAFGAFNESQIDEVEALLTNVKVILAGLEAYGSMWAGIDIMAGEVRAALEAATRLPIEVQSQTQRRLESGSPAIEE